MKELTKNYIPTVIILILWYIFFTTNGYYNWFLFYNIRIIDFTINTKDIFFYLMVLYFIILIPFYIIEKEKSKARIIFWVIKNKLKDSNYKINLEEKNSILAWLVKLFFAPLMIVWISSNISEIINIFYYSKISLDSIISNFNYMFDNFIFITLFKIIIFIDLFFFTIWYLVESKYLWNKIKSVEPTMVWWVVALICYPPFNWAIDNFIWWYSSDFPKFENLNLHILFNILLIISFAIYSRASISLWFKASNLTNRWIIEKWPYKYVRHPAYISKNIAWLIWALPLIIINVINFNFFNLIIIFLSLWAWMSIYYMRAMTEERHLEMDKKYIEYKKKVRYKFIPWIY